MPLVPASVLPGLYLSDTQSSRLADIEHRPFRLRSSNLAIMLCNFGDEQWLNTDDRKGAAQAKIGAAGLIHVPKRKKS